MSSSVTPADEVRASELPRLSRSLALVTLGVLGLSYVLNAMDRQVFPVLLPDIRTEFGFSLAQGGLLATIFTLGIGLAGLPSGYLLDRLSRRAVILMGVGIFSAFTLLTPLAVGYWDMFAYRTLSGVGEAMQNAALFSAVGAYFFANRAMALGSLNFAYGIGSFLGPLLGAHFATAYGTWRAPFFIYGGIGVRPGDRHRRLRLPAVHRADRECPLLDRPAAFDHVPQKLYNRNLLLLGVTAVVVGHRHVRLHRSVPDLPPGAAAASAAGTPGSAASMFGIGALMGLPAGLAGRPAQPAQPHDRRPAGRLGGGLPALQRSHRRWGRRSCCPSPRARWPAGSCS